MFSMLYAEQKGSLTFDIMEISSENSSISEWVLFLECGLTSKGSFFECAILQVVIFLEYDLVMLSFFFSWEESVTYLDFNSVEGHISKLFSDDPALVSLPFELFEGVLTLLTTNLLGSRCLLDCVFLESSN